MSVGYLTSEKFIQLFDDPRVYIYIYTHEGHQIIEWIFPKELAVGSSVSSYTFFKEINNDNSFQSHV